MVIPSKLLEWAKLDKALAVRGKSLFCTALFTNINKNNIIF